MDQVDWKGISHHLKFKYPLKWAQTRLFISNNSCTLSDEKIIQLLYFHFYWSGFVVRKAGIPFLKVMLSFLWVLRFRGSSLPWPLPKYLTLQVFVVDSPVHLRSVLLIYTSETYNPDKKLKHVSFCISILTFTIQSPYRNVRYVSLILINMFSKTIS